MANSTRCINSAHNPQAEALQHLSRFAPVIGCCYLLIIAAGIFGQVFVRNSLVVPQDALATVENLLASPDLWRAAIAGDIFMHACDIPVMVFFYCIFSTVNRPLALTALVSNILQTAVALANKFNLVFPLLLLGDLSGLPTPEVSTLIAQLVSLHDYGFAIALIFFGISCVLYGALMIRSGFLPKLIGLGIVCAGVCYLVNSVTLLLAPHWAGQVFYILLLCFIAELALALTLILKGVNGTAFFTAKPTHEN